MSEAVTLRDAPRHAAVLIVTAMMIIGGIDTFVARIAEFAGLWQFHGVRAQMALPLLWGAARIMGWSLWPKRPRAVALRSLSSALAMLVYFGCLAILPIGQVVAGLHTSPLFVLLFTGLVLRERIGPRRIAAVAVGFVGMVLILQPGTEAMSLWAALPVLAGALYACSVMMTRYWCAQETPASMLFVFFLALGSLGWIGAVAVTYWAPAESTTFALRPWVWAPGAAFYGYTTVQAVGSLIAVSMLVRGYQCAAPSRVAPFEYTLLIFAPLWGFSLWGESLTPLVVGGMGLILASGLILSSVQSRESL